MTRTQRSITLILRLTAQASTQTDKTDTNEYVIRIRGIAAYDLEKQFTVYVNGTKAVDYSPLRYCYMAQNSDDAKLSNTVKALYLYWFEAEKYFV